MATEKKSGLRLFPIFVAIIAGIVGIRYYSQGQETSWILPYALLFTNQREWAYELWVKHATADKRVVYPAMPIPEIQAADYTYEILKKATDNFRHPVVVR